MFYLIFASILIGYCDSNCIWYGSGCVRTNYNCFYNGQPKPLMHQKAREVLTELCPDLVDSMDSGLCCDGKQLKTLKSQMIMAGTLISNCPSCHRNFRQIFCQSTCSPDHDKFMRIDKTIKKRGKTGISAATYFIAEPVLFNTISSCNKNYGYFTGFSINALCGTSKVEDCSPKVMAHFLGSQAPFELNFTVLGSGEHHNDGNDIYYGSHSRTVRCSDPTPEGEAACKPDDCHYQNSYHNLESVRLDSSEDNMTSNLNDLMVGSQTNYVASQKESVSAAKCLLNRLVSPSLLVLITVILYRYF